VLQQAIARIPDDASNYLRLGNLYLDAYDFEQAGHAFERALLRDPASVVARLRLSRCFNAGRHFAKALAILAAACSPDAGVEAEIHMQRGLAFLGQNCGADAEEEFRRAVAAFPDHRRALMNLAKLLRRDGRVGELLALCERLEKRGVRHTQLLLDWGRASALAGDAERTRQLLFDRTRANCAPIAPPRGFNDVQSFNAALADELLSNPNRLTFFPEDEEANRGSARVQHLFAGRRPGLIRLLLEIIEERIDAVAGDITRTGGFDPWRDAMPRHAHLRGWGLIQRGEDYETWHTHRGGWMSGCYYIAIPPCVTAEGEGRGCIEFGPPPSLADIAHPIETWRLAPQEGMLLLAPSHYHHRTVPTGAHEYRISLAFDVIADDQSAIGVED